MLVINSIEKSRLSADSYSYSGTGVAWKARFVLFLGFALMAGGLAGSVVSGTDCLTLMPLIDHAGHSCSQIRRASLSFPDIILRDCERRRKRHDHDQVSSRILDFEIRKLTTSSSVVLWVSQNMEDDYTYNLAL